MTENRDALIDKFNARMKQVQARVDLLKAKAEEADADTRMKLRKEIEEIQARRNSLESRLGELKNSGSEAWRDLQAGAEAGWRALSSAVERAASRFG